MATARQCAERRKISAGKWWMLKNVKKLEVVEVENVEEPPTCIMEHPRFQAVHLNYWVFLTHDWKTGLKQLCYH